MVKTNIRLRRVPCHNYDIHLLIKSLSRALCIHLKLLSIIQYNPIIEPLTYNGFRVAVLRLDLLHPEVSGNKWFKLKYNIRAALDQQKDTILTFGGAYSNHIAATAAACKAAGLRSIGFIRGEKPLLLNHTLQKATNDGMVLQFIDREQYRQKTDPEFLDALLKAYPGAYIIPEGGHNQQGMEGCREILTPATDAYATICCAIGTGTMFKGMRQALGSHQTLVGVSALKGFEALNTPQARVYTNYHAGGYARHTPALLAFKTSFEQSCGIPLDYVYTAKLFYTVFDLLEKGMLEEKTGLLIVHSGGLQGNTSYEARYNLNPSRQLIEPQG